MAEPEYNGAWRATFTAADGAEREADVTIDGLAGTWHSFAGHDRGRRDACAGAPLPMTLSDAGTSTLTIRIEASRHIPGCRDRSARLTLMPDGALQGEFSNGRRVRLVRK